MSEREYTGRGVALMGATLTSGLMAGTFYAFSVGILLGLGRASDRTFVEGMQEINKAIVNGWFMIAFLGALALPALAAVLQYRSGTGRRTVLPWILTGLVLYFVTFAVTVGAEIPLNEALIDAGPVDRIPDLARVRDDFESKWVAWNLVRVLAGTASLGALGRALVLHGRETATGRTAPAAPRPERVAPPSAW